MYKVTLFLITIISIAMLQQANLLDDVINIALHAIGM